MTDGGTANDYDSFAALYAAQTESNVLNAYYALPAMEALAGDVRGRHVLDAGCGAGALTARLRDRGATVSGFDASAAMVALARERLGDDVDVRVAALGEPLPYDDASFDDAVSSLVLHYLEDWGPALAELRRVLRPGGRLVVAVHHPFADYAHLDPRPDYHATTSWTEEWTFGEQAFPMTFWRRPLHAMTEAFTAAGFRLSVVSEPQPDPAARELFPDDFRDLSTKITFLFFVLEVPGP
ncbi:class I SAM-dependent methyltransferase [Cellulomonas fimi]|uniref:Methyltransferase type 11 n=1 Tax=Cellulomonas fimi (strain ATCC 484 / DSM 20113 / JCM 1341 / CCUG 24087 / LMG 16345 / NBRC 15513 / NCIMB 8980 / NCTC 7547 / NRS-133) TaxID=590998 RepID=F4H7L6_CELFA|nr:class I SAM-dependent methyltransferase [Cellulomonas fimi]AEE44573.1 Methyltransferase type 11 [Cellulomonas fimi ATCC 484]NNH06451.1 class I SAM-dependent methyltransferase [Cellulomonas fimi]VEH26662.1 Malonyl-CoA O-methyltransferase BioC [Cellulomonas fimi]